ncbi:MAG: type II/IV secretion system protein, partial [Sedimentisphaerales bacterium]|nr:type II/IV secretion system protein [Sedimentisphaerales bacterium]
RDPKFVSAFPAAILLERQIMPAKIGDKYYAIMSDPFDTTGVDELRVVAGIEFEIALAGSVEISRYIKEVMGLGADTVQSMFDEARESGIEYLGRGDKEENDLSKDSGEASMIRFVNQILTEAIESRATDVHIEPFEHELQVRYRIDGVLQAASIPPEIKQFQPAIVSRIKILSHLDIAEKRVPQDGRIKLVLAGREIDVRVSIIPMLYGEAVVLRILDRGAVLLGPENIGMGGEDVSVFKEILTKPHGIILVTGPTGSGKTTTLYAALSHINDIGRKIITIEDPIEYQLHGINQIQVSNKAGLTFAKGLRSILRHDPDVILVGEIRDLETAEIAVQASLTGHLVFSTLHTNDAPGALVRLVDMGIEPYLVSSSLEAVIAQRLVRLICPKCKEPLDQVEVDRARLLFGDKVGDKIYRGRGCSECQGTGYCGRAGIFEIMVVTEDIRTMLLQNATPRDIAIQAKKDGMRMLRDDAFRYIREGRSTLEELMRVTKDENKAKVQAVSE